MKPWKPGHIESSNPLWWQQTNIPKHHAYAHWHATSMPSWTILGSCMMACIHDQMLSVFLTWFSLLCVSVAGHWRCMTAHWTPPSFLRWTTSWPEFRLDQSELHSALPYHIWKQNKPKHWVTPVVLSIDALTAGRSPSNTYTFTHVTTWGVANYYHFPEFSKTSAKRQFFRVL